MREDNALVGVGAWRLRGLSLAVGDRASRASRLNWMTITIEPENARAENSDAGYDEARSAKLTKNSA